MKAQVISINDNDVHAIEAGYVTITPLDFDLTHVTRLEQTKSWDLGF